jgi:hypothetical protein
MTNRIDILAMVDAALARAVGALARGSRAGHDPGVDLDLSTCQTIDMRPGAL